VAGYDDGQPPLLGQVTCSPVQEIGRPKEYPWRVIVPEERTDPMDRMQADVQALEFAVDIARDRLGGRAPANKLSGQKAFALWARLLRDPEGWGAHFYHANVLGHLRPNRRSAVAYLEAMSKRHPGPAATHLLAAARAYLEGLDRLGSADASKGTLEAAEGREELARLVEAAAQCERQAAGEMEAALAAMR